LSRRFPFTDAGGGRSLTHRFQSISSSFGIQAFYLPVWIWAHQTQPEYLPFLIGCLAGSHFLPYTWIYDSRAYLVTAFGIVSVSVIFGLAFREHAFTLVPFSFAAFFLLGTWLIARENRKNGERKTSDRPPQP